uniref:Uncharacterized protein n=1 Tax=Arundo donax TaxID=35708 RepID=A0A0A8YCX9_ARUDO
MQIQEFAIFLHHKDPPFSFRAPRLNYATSIAKKCSTRTQASRCRCSLMFGQIFWST